ncbi:MAG: heparan-alpha-glucosaminide N-acetyltransferase domain-containing protein [Myxococcota bacterium]
MSSKKRYAAVDHARGMAVVLMVLVHTLWIYGSDYTQTESFFGHFVHFVGRGTPMFLVAMGFSFILSSRQSFTSSALRGVILLAAGFVMNALKFLVPYAFGFLPASFLAAYGWEAPLTGEQLLYLLATGDILQLAGLSLILMGAIRAVTDRVDLTMAAAVVVAIAGGWLRGLRPGIPGLDYAADLLWGAEWNVYFPVFPWAAVIIFGMALGRAQTKAEDDTVVFRRMFPLGLVLALVGGALCYYDPEFHINDFFHLGPGGAIHLMGIGALLMWLSHVMTNALSHRFGWRQLCVLLKHASRRVTTLYVIQWVMICWGMAIIGYKTLSPLQVALLFPVILVLCLAIDEGARRAIQALRSPKPLVPPAPKKAKA